MAVNNNVIEKVHMFLISLSLFLTPFTGVSGMSFLGSMGKTASVYPMLIGIILWIGQRRGIIPIPQYKNYLFLLLFYIIAILSIGINLDEIQYYHFQGQIGLQRAVVQLVSLGFCVIIPIYVYDILRNCRGNIYGFLFRCLEYSFYVAGIYSIVELLAFFNVGDASSCLAFLDGLFRDEEPNGNVMRIRSVTLEPSALGEYIAIILPWMIYRSGCKKRYFFLTLYLLILCFLSVSRTAYVVLIVQFFLCAIMYGAKYKRIIGIFMAVLIFIGSIFYAQVEDYLGERTFDVVVMSVIDSEGTVFDLSNVARYGSQDAALKMFNERPIYGVGYGMYGFLAPDYYPQYSWISKEILVRSMNTTQDGAWPPVHSLIARIMSETGIMGIFSWLMMIFFTVYYIYRYSIRGREKNYMYASAALISLIGCFLMEFKTDSIYVIPLYIIMGLSMVIIRNDETGEV